MANLGQILSLVLPVRGKASFKSKRIIMRIEQPTNVLYHISYGG